MDVALGLELNEFVVGASQANGNGKRNGAFGLLARSHRNQEWIA